MAFCTSREGWGPVSSERVFDLTPCFEDGALIGGSLLTIFLGGILQLYLLRDTPINPRATKTRKWLVAKLFVLSVGALLSIAALVFTILQSPDVLKDEAVYVAGLRVLTFPVAALLTRSNHTKTRRSSDLLLVFWPINAIAQFLWLKTDYEEAGNRLDTLSITLTAVLGVVVLSSLLECKGPERVEDLEDRETPYLIANFYSRMAYSWMTPLMQTGASRFITEEDMYELVPEDTSKYLGERLRAYWDRQPKKNSWALWRALAHSYGRFYSFAAMLKILQDLLAFAQPQLLRMLLTYITAYQTSENMSKFKGVALAASMFLAALIQTSILHQYFYICFLTGMRIRAGLVTTVYEKALVLSNDAQGSRGDIVNLMSVDATRMQDLTAYGLIFVSGPFQILLAFVSLYNLLGWPSFVGVAIMVVSVPLQGMVAQQLKKLQGRQMKIRDQRTKMMSEVLSNIKSIKLYSWETAFMKMVTNIRNTELNTLRIIGVTTALNMVVWQSVPMLVAFATFAVTAYFGKTPLTADIIFPAISLFNLLGFPLAMFATVTSSIVQASVSVNRLATFFGSSELQSDAVQHEEVVIAPGEEVVNITNGDFKWSVTDKDSTLADINLTVKKGELVGVMGRVGCGKTSLLSAIVGEMTRTDGTVKVRGNVAYAPQNPWIMSSTVRDNITFFRKFDQTYYDLVLEACALKQDLALLPDKDLTEVGEKGITLSGGQRARISLARAVYARADLYLLDDVLAAVDAHVARHVFDHVIGPDGLLASKARIHVTNNFAFLAQHDSILFIRRGIILESGSYSDFSMRPESEIYKLLTGAQTLSANQSRNPSGSATPINSEGVVQMDEIDADKAAKLIDRRKSQKPPSFVSPEEQKSKMGQTLNQAHQTITKEISEQGEVKRTVYWQYVKSASLVGGFAYVFSTVLQQASNVASNWVLKNWGENNLSNHPRPTGYYLAWFGAFVGMSAFFSAAAGVLLWVTLAIRSARNLHERMLFSVLRAPLQFFESTPQGRIMNLFSRDQYVVDEVIVRVFSGFMRTLATVAGIFIVIVVSFPLSLLAIVPLVFVYRAIMRYYLATSREIKRLDAVSKSPIFAWFQESLGGLSTIRAYRLQKVFVLTNEIRLDANQRCYMPSTNVNRWLAVRLEFVGGFIVLTTSMLSMAALFSKSGVDAGLVGFVLSYALNTTQSLNWVVRMAGEVEQNIVSVERILQYVGLKPEAPYEIPETRPADMWPSKGAIEFNHYSMRYRPDLNRCLNDLNLNIRGGERIGICGRTGAGKSSLTLGLLRILEADEGTILIDGVDISKIGLHELRSAISIIPQEPQLFEGTIRQNVDPTESFDDLSIWDALGHAHLKEYIQSLDGGLDAVVREGGTSLSSGQRQLLCFARALLRKSKILILDEATSAVDLQTDLAVQEIIRGEKFAGVTMLTIAHRLNTILNSDRILVLDSGEVAEFDTPENLMADSTSRFYSLANEAGIFSTKSRSD